MRKKYYLAIAASLFLAGCGGAAAVSPGEDTQEAEVSETELTESEDSAGSSDTSQYPEELMQTEMEELAAGKRDFPLEFKQGLIDYPKEGEIRFGQPKIPELIGNIDELAQAVDTEIFLTAQTGSEIYDYTLTPELAAEFKEDMLGMLGKSMQIAPLAHNFLESYDESRIDENILGIRATMWEDYATVIPEAESTERAVNFAFYVNYLQGRDPGRMRLMDLPMAEGGAEYLKVKNSEELFYAVSNGYLPYCEQDSAAYEIFDRCLQILSAITNEQMSEKEIYEAIYQYVVQSNLYDYDTLMDTGSQDYRNQSMFLDGPVLDGIAVCDGLTKEIVVLSRLMGIESYHIGARDAMSGHAYVYANVDGTWYLSCPTSGIERYPLTDTEWQSYHTSNFMLTDFDTNMPSWAYDSDAFEDTIEAEMLKNTVTEDYWSNTALSLGGKSVTLHPGSLEEALLVLRYAHALQSVLKMPVEAELCGSVDVLRDAYDTLKAEGISVAYLSGGTFEGQRLQVYLFDGKDGESGASGEKAKEAEDKSKDAKEHSEGTKETIEDEKEQHEDAEKKAKVSAEEWDKFRNGKTFASDLEEEALPRPKEVLTCLDDFVYAMDYLAFYRVSGSVFFSFSDEYAESFFNPYTEYQKAYLHSDLADVYPCQMDDSYFSKYGVISVKYSISKDVASAAPKQLPDTPAVPSFDYENENTAGDAALRIDTADLEEIPCENSEQLYYLAMNGFRPVPVDGSVAEELYEKAAEVLASIIREDMSDFEKIKAVYDYLTTEVRYDYATAYSEDTYLVKEQAYYLEGVFFNHTAVCDGKAKAYALMLNMLGIPCYRDTGTSEGGDHAWNVVQLDGKWYISCTTYGQGNAGESLGRLLPNYATLLAGSMTPYGEEGWGFRSQKHTDVTELLEEEAYDVYGAMSVSSGETLKVGSMEDTRSMLEHIEKEHTREYKVEFMYTGEDIEGYQDELVSYLETLDHVNAVPVVSETDPVYQVLYLK